MLGRVGPAGVELTEISRFGNGPVALPDGLHWDVLGLYTEVLAGIRAAAAQHPGLLGIAVDSWAVDYGLLDQVGRLIGNPYHYRDARNAAGVRAVHDRIEPAELYRINGLQHLPFNTLYQLRADRDQLAGAASALLIPDLIGYWLSGHRLAELTNASTTGLVEASTAGWSAKLLELLDLPAGLLPELVAPGTLIGPLSPAVRAETGLTASTLLSTVGSHDTASAVVGVPAADEHFGYISCGTWGLVGVELDRPVLTEQGRLANFTNERGLDGTVRYLRNVMGLWLLQECLRCWQLAGSAADLDALLAAAAELPAGGPVIDVNDPSFLPPGDMPARIEAACRARGVPAPTSPPEYVRCVLDSLAQAFAASIGEAARLSGKRIDVVHLVGGGSRNKLLCQLTADASGLPVVAGPVEATALGNILVQARTHGIISGDLFAIRRLLRENQSRITYRPEGS